MPGGPGGPCKTGRKISLLNSLIETESLRSFPVQLGPDLVQQKHLAICHQLVSKNARCQTELLGNQAHEQNRISCLSH